MWICMKWMSLPLQPSGTGCGDAMYHMQVDVTNERGYDNEGYYDETYS